MRHNSVCWIAILIFTLHNMGYNTGRLAMYLLTGSACLSFAKLCILVTFWQRLPFAFGMDRAGVPVPSSSLLPFLSALTAHPAVRATVMGVAYAAGAAEALAPPIRKRKRSQLTEEVEDVAQESMRKKPKVVDPEVDPEDEKMYEQLSTDDFKALETYLVGDDFEKPQADSEEKSTKSTKRKTQSEMRDEILALMVENMLAADFLRVADAAHMAGLYECRHLLSGVSKREWKILKELHEGTVTVAGKSQGHHRTKIGHLACVYLYVWKLTAPQMEQLAQNLSANGHKGAARHVRGCKGRLRYVGEAGDFEIRDRQHSRGPLFFDVIFAAAIRVNLEPLVYILKEESDRAKRNLQEALYASALACHISHKTGDLNICACGGPRYGVKYSIDRDDVEVKDGTRKPHDMSPLTYGYAAQFEPPLKTIAECKSAMGYRGAVARGLQEWARVEVIAGRYIYNGVDVSDLININDSMSMRGWRVWGFYFGVMGALSVYKEVDLKSGRALLRGRDVNHLWSNSDAPAVVGRRLMGFLAAEASNATEIGQAQGVHFSPALDRYTKSNAERGSLSAFSARMSDTNPLGFKTAASGFKEDDKRLSGPVRAESPSATSLRRLITVRPSRTGTTA